MFTCCTRGWLIQSPAQRLVIPGWVNCDCKGSRFCLNHKTKSYFFRTILLSEAERFLSLDIAGLQSVDFEYLFEANLKPFEAKYKEAKDVATGLWREYSAMSNRLDFLPLDSEDYKSLDILCDAKKAEYNTAHAQTDRLYREW